MTINRTSLLLGVLVCVAVLGAALAQPDGASVGTLGATQVVPEQVMQPAVCSAPDAGALVEPSVLPEAPSVDAVCSPPPECWTDRDCNRVCGKKVGGQCVVVNSCYRYCACHAA